MSRPRRVDLAIAALQDKALRAIDKPLGRYQLEILEQNMNEAIAELLIRDNNGNVERSTQQKMTAAGVAGNVVQGHYNQERREQQLRLHKVHLALLNEGIHILTQTKLGDHDGGGGDRKKPNCKRKDGKRQRSTTRTEQHPEVETTGVAETSMFSANSNNNVSFSEFGKEIEYR
jgi:hypothetical protein